MCSFAYTTAQTPSNPQRATQYLYENSTWADLLTETRDVYFSDRSGGTNTAENAENALANALLNGRYTKVDMSAKLSGNGNNRTEFLDGEYPVTSDAIGNITSYNGFTYSYLGRQLQGLNNGESGVSYGYNADGQRISKSYDSIEGFALDYEYYYNGSTLAGFRLYVIDCVEAEEYLVSFMYDENGEPFGFTVDGDSYYYVRNAQNDIFLIVDSDNQGVVLYQYDAWGNVTACYDTSDGSILSLVNPYTYRGYYYDIETGYYYLNSRYYSPQLHRFISADGLVQTGQGMLDKNMFAYCLNNPTNYSDFDGHFAGALLGALVSALPYIAVFAVVAVVAIALTQPKVIQEASSAIGNAIDDIKDKKKRPNDNTVYKLVDSSGKTQYVGRTKNVTARKNAHNNDPNRKHLKMIIIEPNLNYYQARGLEQIYMLYYHTKNTKDRMNNQINGISPSNKLLNAYMEAGRGAISYLDNQISNEILYWSGE